MQGGLQPVQQAGRLAHLGQVGREGRATQLLQVLGQEESQARKLRLGQWLTCPGLQQVNELA